MTTMFLFHDYLVKSLPENIYYILILEIIGFYMLTVILYISLAICYLIVINIYNNYKNTLYKIHLYYLVVSYSITQVYVRYNITQQQCIYNTTYKIIDFTRLTIYTMYLLYIIQHHVLTKFKLKGHYAILHTIINLIVTYNSFIPAYKLFTEPHNNWNGLYTNYSTLSIITGLHLYHIIHFYPISKLNVIHHVLMIGIVLPASFITTAKYIPDYCSIVICGFPGAGSYLVYALYKNNIISHLLEKRINTIINTWIRSPFVIISGYIIFIRTYHYRNSNGVYNNILGIIVALICSWNGIYYTRRIVEDYSNSRLKSNTNNKINKPNEINVC